MIHKTEFSTTNRNLVKFIIKLQFTIFLSKFFNVNQHFHATVIKITTIQRKVNQFSQITIFNAFCNFSCLI